MEALVGPLMKQDKRYEVRNQELEQKLKDLGKIINNLLPPGVGFTLMLFKYGSDKGLFYISSANREDMLATMKFFIAKQEGHIVDFTSQKGKVQ